MKKESLNLSIIVEMSNRKSREVIVDKVLLDKKDLPLLLPLSFFFSGFWFLEQKEGRLEKIVCN